jgi:hypothetical protein
VQSGKTASGGCSAGQGSSEPVAPRIYLFILFTHRRSFYLEKRECRRIIHIKIIIKLFNENSLRII